MKDFWKLVRKVRKEDAAAFPYRFRFVERLSNKEEKLRTYSDCLLIEDKGKKYFRIRFARDAIKSDEELYDCLFHEVAHAITWSHLHDVMDDPEYHNDAFWLSYGALRRKYLKEK